MKTKMKYIAPALELHLYQAEIGYAGSWINPNDDNHSNGMERWDWNPNGGNGFNEGTDNGGQGTGWTWEP